VKTRIKTGVASPVVTAMISGVSIEALTRTVFSGFDLVLQIDQLGVVRQVSHVSSELISSNVKGEANNFKFESWVGKRLSEIAATDSRPKLIEQLRAASQGIEARWRQVNFPLANGASLLLSLAMTPSGGAQKSNAALADSNDLILVLARDLKGISKLQQQLVEVQQKLERDYSRLRFMETRYQALLQTSQEAILIVDEGTLKVLEVNPVATQLLVDWRKNGSRERLNKTLPEYFDAASRPQISAWLARLNRDGVAASEDMVLKHSSAPIKLRASLVRQQDGNVYLVTLNSESAADAQKAAPQNIVASVVDGMPDAMVVTDADGQILIANASFLEIAQCATIEQARGESLARWLSRGEVDFSVLLGTVRQHGAVRQYVTDMRGNYGSSVAVEISGVMRSIDGLACYGFSIRDVARRVVPETDNDRFVPRSSEELKELVGRVPLKDIVGETADLIERLCIESALELTGDNRAAAAEMLGLSRQSLYVKLRRFGVGSDEDNQPN
jgi:transcriptional regulator PpsR